MRRHWLFSFIFVTVFTSVSLAEVQNILGVNVSGPKPNLPLTISINCTDMWSDDR